MAPTPQTTERALKIGRILVPICAAAGVAAANFVPIVYRDVVAAFCGGVFVGMVLVLAPFWWEQQKAKPPKAL